MWYICNRIWLCWYVIISRINYKYYWTIIDRSNNIIYGLELNGNNQLYKLELCDNNKITKIADANLGQDVWCLSYNNGYLYAIDVFAPRNIHKIDPITGNLNIIGATDKNLFSLLMDRNGIEIIAGIIRVSQKQFFKAIGFDNNKDWWPSMKESKEWRDKYLNPPKPYIYYKDNLQSNNVISQLAFSGTACYYMKRIGLNNIDIEQELVFERSEILHAESDDSDNDNTFKIKINKPNNNEEKEENTLLINTEELKENEENYNNNNNEFIKNT